MNVKQVLALAEIIKKVIKPEFYQSAVIVEDHNNGQVTIKMCGANIVLNQNGDFIEASPKIWDSRLLDDFTPVDT